MHSRRNIVGMPCRGNFEFEVLGLVFEILVHHPWMRAVSHLRGQQHHADACSYQADHTRYLPCLEGDPGTEPGFLARHEKFCMEARPPARGKKRKGVVRKTLQP